MKRTTTRALLASLVLIPLFTCRLPPYDEGLSLGIETAREMVALGAEEITVGPIWVWDYDFRDRELYFIPNKGTILDEFKSGFMAASTEQTFDLFYVEHTGGDIFNLYSGWGIGITDDDPKNLNFRAEPVKWGSYLSFIRFDSENYRNNQYFLIEWNSGSFFAPDVLGTGDPEGHLRSFIHTDVFGSDAAKNPTIIGSSIWPLVNSVNYDDQFFFCRFDDNGRYAEVQYRTDTASGLTVPGIILEDIEFNFPDNFENAFYHHNGNTNVSYLSYYSRTQRKYKSYSWDGSGLLKPLIKMDRRINAVLTTRRLLSFDNNRCYVYNEEGNKQFDFLLGGLHFCYEIDLGGTNNMVFTLPAMLGIWDQEDELYFKVYLLPTDLLEDLE